MKYKDLPKYNSHEWLLLDSFDGEIWKDIEGYEGIYQVSNYGRIKSLERDVKRCDGRSFHFAERILKYKKARGYDCVGLSDGKKNKFFRVHRLVGFAFIPNPDNKPQMNHKDENPHNNMADNLEWCTSKYNNNYGSHNKKLSETKKRKYIEDKVFAERVRISLREMSKRPSWKKAQRAAQLNNKVTSKPVEQFTLEGLYVNRYQSVSEATRCTGILSQNIGQVCLGRKKQAGGFIWRYNNNN